MIFSQIYGTFPVVVAITDVSLIASLKASAVDNNEVAENFDFDPFSLFDDGSRFLKETFRFLFVLKLLRKIKQQSCKNYRSFRLLNDGLY